ncbi:MAG: T9SS type B sorting domain-containing protein, partial [Phaeodactylibacter sp.]|nr:T9SS type B sorting domain-containing protein [Phaeodactylibacter sp.]
TFSNITITCIDDSPTLPNLGPYCQSGSPVALPSNPGGVSGTWSGPGVSGTTFNPAAAGAGTWVLTFTAAPGECAGSATTSVTVTPFTTPTFTPLAAVCQSAAPIALLTTSQNGISGNWSGTGVSGNTFNPSTAGPGAHTLTFTPAPGSCATTAMLSITVNAAATPTFAPLAALCQTATSVALPTISQNGISGNWSGTGVSGNAFNPSTAGPGVHTLTFTPSPGLCAVPATLTAQVTATTTPMLTPQGPFCSTDPPANLPLVQDGITGSWAGTGVTGGNTFTPATTGNGTFLLTFTPGAGQCANPNSINVMVSGPTATAPAQPLSICYTPIPFSYTDNLAAIVNTINNGTGQQVNWYLDMAGNNSIDPTDPADIQALILGGPNQTIYAAVFNGTCESATIPVNVVLAQSATPALTPQGPFCQGNPAVNLPTSQGGFTGSWSGPGVNNNTFNPNTAGTFPLTFTPAAGQCARPNTLNVTVSTPATPTLNPIGPFCQTAPPVALSTNQGGFNGSWSGPGVNNNSFNPAATGTGTFTITFTPAAGQCAIPNTLNVTVGNITANPAGPLTACDTGNGLATFNLTSLNPQVSQGAGTVNWFLDPGATAPINNPGNFQGGDGQQVYATVSNGTCTSSPVAVQLIVLPLPAANPFSLFECETGNGTATFNLTDANGNVSGGAPVSVSWSFSPAGTPLIPNPSAFVSDDFTVFAIVSNGSCQNSAPVTLTVFDAPNPVLTVATPILCNGDANGSLSLVVTGGQPAYDFDWNINALDGIQNPSALGPGTYSVTVSDGNSCEGTASINLVQPAPLTMNCSVTNPVLTPGGTEGEASVSFSGGTAPFSISWVGPVNGSGTAPTPGTILIPDLEEGTYTVTVQDANGCTNTCTFTVNGPGCDLQLSFNNQQPESCPGAMDGAVDLVITGGTAPFTIDWNDGDTLTTRTGLSAGLYSVTVDDSNGCQASSTLTLGTANPAPQVTIATADTICENECFLFGLQFQGTPPFVLEYAVDTGINQQVLLFESMVTDTALEVCPVDYGRSDGPLEVRFGLLSDANCTDTLNRLEVIQVQPTPAGAFNVVLCPGDSLIYNGTVYNEANLSGMEVLGGAATNGCDSIVAVTIGFFPADTTLVGAQSCDPAQAGRDTLSLQSMNGCDSIVITETLFVPSDTIFLTDTSCDPAQAGLDTLFLQNVAGCDSLVITETFFDANAADTTLLSASTCDPALVGIDTVFLQNTSGCDSLVITETVLLPSDETFLMAGSCDPTQAGVDTVFLQNTAGCDSLVITETFFIPGDETFLTMSSCDPAAVGVDTLFLQNVAGCDSLVITETLLLPTSTTVLERQLCSGEVLMVNGNTYSESNPTGIEVIPGGAANGCDSIIQVSLTFSEGATGFIEGGRPICPGEALELTVRLQGATSYNVNISDGANVVESYTGISGDVTFSVSPAVSTVYQISLLTAVGSLCPVEIGAGATVTVVQGSDIAVEVLTDYGGFGVSCNGSADAVVGVSAADPGLSYQWNTGQATPTLNNVGAGTYSVTVTSPAGCSAEGSATVTAPAPIIAKADAIDIDCFSELSGSILIESLDGGSGPYEYSLDGQFFNPLGSLPAAIPGLSAGAYTIFFQDANDCLTQAQVQIAAFEGLSLELGEDQTLKLGDSLQLRPQASFEVASFTWAPLTGLLDSASFSPYVRPMETTAYFLTATDSAGCVARDQIIIFINKERGLYAPNVFSPNEDGRNDFFTLFAGPDVAAIRTFQVFDRWGNLLFERAPFQPNIENLGWDGAFNGEPLDPAVFVFYAEVEYVDGFTEVVKGDFVLMR